MIRAQGLSYSVGSRQLTRSVDLEVKPREVLVVLGPNGAGKTTLLRLLSGELRPSQGNLSIDGKPLSAYSSKELARRRAVLPQTESLRFGFLVHEVVALGRYPWGAGTSTYDRSIVTEAMKAAGAIGFSDRLYTELSAGERARVHLARVFAQIWKSPTPTSRYLLLDEPTACLDLAHQHEVLGAIRQFSSTGIGVIMVLHDLNLAQLYADRVVLMQDGTVYTSGSPVDVLNEETIRRVFDVDAEFIPSGVSTHPWIAVRPPPMRRPITRKSLEVHRRH